MSPTQSSPPRRTWRIRNRVRSENARNIRSTVSCALGLHGLYASTGGTVETCDLWSSMIYPWGHRRSNTG